MSNETEKQGWARPSEEEASQKELELFLKIIRDLEYRALYGTPCEEKRDD